ncbi:hypothetical protein HRbin15_01379 [bacterium HR15]|nr:hypothetical protein HRbin15_01379 [bacterium HR15]
MRTILTTVGASLLNNARRNLRRGSNEAVSLQELTNYLRQASPEEASAETNSLKRLLQEGDRIVLLYSDTDEGDLCANALKAFYSHQGYQVEIARVHNLNYTESRFKMLGLRSLVATLIEHIQKERKAERKVLINATGGFKAEVAYATLVGLLFNVSVYYIHEAFQDIIEIPPIPINWDYSLFASYEEFFEWIDSEPRKTGEVQQRLHNLPAKDKIYLLLRDEPDGCTYLSPAGETFYRAYEERMTLPGEPILLSRKAREAYQSAEPSTRESFDKVLRKLRHPDLRSNQTELVRNGDCLVYPRGHCNERVIFYEQEGKIYVCELVRHSDESYERLISERVLREHYGDFTPWSG